MKHEQHKPCDVVLGAAHRGPRSAVIIACVAAALLHVGGAAAAVALGATADHTPVAKKSAPLVVIDHVIDLDPPAVPEVPQAEPPAPPPPPPPVEKAPPRSKQKAPPRIEQETPEPPLEQAAPPAAPEPEKPPSEPPPAAQAAQVVAADNAAANAAFNIATGAGSAYSGGTTSTKGTGTTANHTGQVGVGTGNGYSKARPPQLHSRNWPCGWPSEAEDLDLEEAFVTVRASIRADGSVENVEVLQDPGNGFGKRASLCARSKVTFDAALDAAGQPIAGKTPPLRIRFVRDEE